MNIKSAGFWIHLLNIHTYKHIHTQWNRSNHWTKHHCCRFDYTIRILFWLLFKHFRVGCLIWYLCVVQNWSRLELLSSSIAINDHYDRGRHWLWRQRWWWWRQWRWKATQFNTNKNLMKCNATHKRFPVLVLKRVQWAINLQGRMLAVISIKKIQIKRNAWTNEERAIHRASKRVFDFQA